MMKPRTEEKKVEYLELIYDLIFVYVVGRNNSLLHNLTNGFVEIPVFLAYVLSSLAIIQIWNFSTFYTNMYGRNGARDHVFMFVNMYLLYYIGEGTRVHWESFQTQYHIAWALILINIGLQYALELRRQEDNPAAKKTVRGLMIALFGEAAVVLAAIPVFLFTGVQLAGVAILFDIAATCLLTLGNRSGLVDFTHLSERAMLYVVFTFGEMIIAVASYFEGGFSGFSVYFSGMSFLIVVGLFLCYELLYNRIIDREKQTSGMGYMMLHIFLLFGLNNITTSLEFMRNEEVLLWPKTAMLVGSFLLLFICLFALLLFAKPQMRRCKRVLIPACALSVLFVAAMLLLREQMSLNILITVLYVFTMFFLLFFFSRRRKGQPLPETCITRTDT